MLTVRDAIPKPQPLAVAEFATLRARLLKIAARITETATRVRIAFALPVPKPICSAASPGTCNPQGRSRWGECPEPPDPVTFNA